MSDQKAFYGQRTNRNCKAGFRNLPSRGEGEEHDGSHRGAQAAHRLRASSAQTPSISGSGLPRSVRIASTKRNFSMSGSSRISCAILSILLAVPNLLKFFL